MSDLSAASSGPASKRYGNLQVAREPFLIRARRISKITIPSLFRNIGENGTTDEEVPWTSIGAYCVNNLSAKLIQTLFPPGIPCIELAPSRKVLNGYQDLDPQVRGDLKAALEKALSGVEQDFTDECEVDGDRWRLFDAVRHLVVGGTHGLKMLPDDKLQSISFERFVNVRDAVGNLLEFVIEDPMEFDSLDEDIQAIAISKGYKEKDDAGNPVMTPLNVYTHGRWKRGTWRVYQECFGEVVPGSEATYTAEALPYLFLRMIGLEKEHYGRSYAEDYEGDLTAIDGFWQVLTEGAAALAQLKWLIKPGSSTNKEIFAKLPNGGVMTGEVEDVHAVVSEKQGDISIAFQVAEKIEKRLERAFVVTSSIVRNGERVTAEEIRQMANELETTMGGVYSNQVTTLQAPYARLKLAGLQRHGRVAKLPKGSVNLTILTGDASLGRLKKAQTLDEYISTSGTALGSPGMQLIAPYLKIGSYLARGAANRGIDTDGLLMSDQERQAAQQQQTAQQVGMQVAPEVTKQVGGMMQNEQQADLQAPPTQGAPPGASPPQPPQQSA